MPDALMFTPSPIDPWDQDALAVVVALVTAELTQTPVDLSVFEDVPHYVVTTTATRLLSQYLVQRGGQLGALKVVHDVGLHAAKRMYLDG